MGLGGCYSCIKYLMFAFNFLFWLLGCAILGVGIWVRVDPNFKDYVESSESFNFLYVGAYVLIVVGVVIMVIGFLGCCGAIRESQCMLALFFIFLFIIFAALLGVGIWAIVSKKTLQQSVTDTLKKAVDEYDSKEAAKNLMNKVQTNFRCCGASLGAIDYTSTTRLSAPGSCSLEHWADPCDQRLFAYFAENLIIIAGVAIGIGIVMILGMVFSMMLCCAIHEARA